MLTESIFLAAAVLFLAAVVITVVRFSSKDSNGNHETGSYLAPGRPDTDSDDEAGR